MRVDTKFMMILSDAQRKTIQKYAFNALIEFDVLCRKHGIKYTLAYGTLIGAIRHKGFIPWDDDIDVCVSRKDFIRLRDIANNELPKGFFYQSHSSEFNWYRLYDKLRVDGTVFREIAYENKNIHQGVYIDVFPLDYIPNSNIAAALQSFLYKTVSATLSAKYISLRQRQGFNKLLSCLLRLVFSPIKKAGYLIWQSDYPVVAIMVIG